MKKLLLVLFGVFSYLLFIFCTLFTIGFLNNRWVPSGIDQGDGAGLGLALLINIGLVSVFGFSHSLLARESIKQKLRRWVPDSSIRSIYVFQSSAILIGIGLLWQPLPLSIWQVNSIPVQWAILGLHGLGWLTVVLATFAINHFDFTGLQQVYHHWLDKEAPKPQFVTPWLYRIVRHPMQTGVLMAFWCTPHMTVGHLVFALTMTVYILIGIRFEERSLVREFGDAYRVYQQSVPALIPGLRSHAREVRELYDQA